MSSGYDTVLSLWRGPIRRPRPQATLREMLEAFAAYEGLTVSDLLGAGRTRRISHPRQDFMLIVYETGRYSLPQIGHFLGGRDHTTILHGVRKAKRRRAQNGQTWFPSAPGAYS